MFRWKVRLHRTQRKFRGRSEACYRAPLGWVRSLVKIQSSRPNLSVIYQVYPSLCDCGLNWGKLRIAFYKYDGSNLRWEWAPKRGWYKYGTRTQLFNETDPLFGQAIPIFQDTMGAEIARRCKDAERGVQRIIVYTEFFGPSSFAGEHELAEPKKLKLFDIKLYKRGIMSPRQFVKTFGDLPYSAQVTYEGNLNKQFIDDVRKGVYPVWEGVVAKGDDFIIKIKTDIYFKKLNEVYGTEYRNYWE